MYKIEDLINPPEDTNIKIWRYLDFTKYVSMLDSQAIFFPRADKLGDPFEGSYPQSHEEIRPEHYSEMLPDNIMLTNFFSNLSSFASWIRQWIYISCWHMNEAESAAMWKLYAKTNEAVAIQTTYAQLRDHLLDNVYVGVVKYIDYEKDWIPESNFLYPYIHKRTSFEHERELRAITVAKLPIEENEISETAKNLNKGLLVEVDLTQLINSIYVAPSSPSWFYSLVHRISKRYRINKPVIQSSLDKAPFF